MLWEAGKLPTFSEAPVRPAVFGEACPCLPPCPRRRRLQGRKLGRPEHAREPPTTFTIIGRPLSQRKALSFSVPGGIVARKGLTVRSQAGEEGSAYPGGKEEKDWRTGKPGGMHTRLPDRQWWDSLGQGQGRRGVGQAVAGRQADRS